MISDDLIKENHNKIGNVPIIWKYYSEFLFKASKDLYDQFKKHLEVDFTSIQVGDPAPIELSFFRVVYMFRAMALECLFKGLWLKGGGILVQNGKLKNITGNDHNLRSLANKVSKKIDLKISKEEKGLLDKLSRYIIAGRYPIPKKWQNLKNIKFLGIPSDDRLFEKLVNRLIKIFEKK